MPTYRVVYKRSFVEYGTVIVVADDVSEATQEAKDMLDDAEWSPQELEEEEHESTTIIS